MKKAVIEAMRRRDFTLPDLRTFRQSDSGLGQGSTTEEREAYEDIRRSGPREEYAA